LCSVSNQYYFFITLRFEHQSTVRTKGTVEKYIEILFRKL